MRLLLLALVLLCPRDTLADDDTVAVPRSELAELQVAHAEMLALIDKQQATLRRMAEVASMCLANFPTSKYQ